MSSFSAEAVRWKDRRGFRLSNNKIEVTILLGGGHIADIRLRGSTINALWEAPWPTIEPNEFCGDAHSALYGERAVGPMLSGYTGHALAIPYFGMPSPVDKDRGLVLHGEAASAEWKVAEKQIGDDSASVTLEAALPLSQLRMRRTLQVPLDVPTITITESVRNRSAETRELQWVEHAAFGEPLLARGEASLLLSGDRAITWPHGYEGHELLPNDLEFQWPRAGGHDLSEPFLEDGTGFVAAVRADACRKDGFIAVHNRRLALAAGYVFEARRFPWIALWEENRARDYAPWNGNTRVRGVEFGTSPMPIGLEEAKRMRQLFDKPVLASVGAGGELTTTYQMFVTDVPRHWRDIRDVRQSGDRVIVESDDGAELLL